MASIFHPRYPDGTRSKYFNLRCYLRGQKKHHYVRLIYPDGRRVKNRQDANYFCSRHELLCSRRPVSAGPLTVEVAFARFLEEAQIQQRLSPRAFYDATTQTTVLNAYVGTRRVAELSPALLDQVLTRLMAERGIGPVSRNNYRKLLRRFGRWCHFRGYVLEDFTVGLDKLKEPPSAKAFLPRIQWPELIAKAQETPLALFVPLALYTGLRRGTLLALTRSDIHLDRHVIVARAEIMKDGEPLCVPIHVELQPILERLLPTDGLVCRGITPRVVDYWLRPWLTALHLAGGRLGSHTLRRSFIMAAAQKLPAQVVRDLVGHASLRTTDGYTERLIASAEQMNAI